MKSWKTSGKEHGRGSTRGPCQRECLFPKNKTKTWITGGSWLIGTRLKELRFLGYWHTKDSTSTEKHTKHWFTKANFAYNQLRALTQRYESGRGLNTLSTIRHLHLVTRTIAQYGMEHSNEEDCKEIDSFLYKTIRRMFDMPHNTPHRAISAEFVMTSTKIQRDYIISRIRHRHETFPDIMRKAREAGNLCTVDTDNGRNEGLLPWHVEVPDPSEEAPIIPLPHDHPTNIGHLMTKIGSTSMVTYTDGSARDNKNPSYGMAVFNYRNEIVYQENGTISKDKSILDAETTAIYKAMEHALNTSKPSLIKARHYILTDSKAALHTVTNPQRKGPTSYFNLWRNEIENHPDREYNQSIIGWVRGHSKIIGNELADRLAKTATNQKDPYPGTTLSKINADISRQRQTDWENWYNAQQHEYQGRPTRRLKKHRGLSRIDSTTLFHLKTNKGWNPDDTIGTDELEKCTDCFKPKNAYHAMTCERYASHRPTDITTDITRPIPRADVIEWIRKNNHFGFENKIYQVAFIRLRVEQYKLHKDLSCQYCDYITSNISDLYKHKRNVHENPTSANRHKLTATEKTCPYCTETFDRADRQIAHVRKHEKENLKASLPETPNQRRVRLAKEKKLEATKTERTCTTCSFIAPNMRAKNSHKKQHEKDKRKGMVQCHGCSQYFPDRKALKEHQRSNCGGSRS